jgi:hypothetical protein
METHLGWVSRIREKGGRVLGTLGGMERPSSVPKIYESKKVEEYFDNLPENLPVLANPGGDPYGHTGL